MIKEFNGSRFKLARLYRGFSIEELASRMGVNKPDIYNLELGIKAPSAEQMLIIVRVLKFPKNFFYFDNIKTWCGYLFYRYMDKISKEEQLMYEQRVKLLGQFHIFLSKYFDFPKINMMKDPYELLDVETLSKNLRNYWNLGNDPIPSMLELLQNNGVLITRISGIDSVFTIFDDKVNRNLRPLIILGDDKPSAVRRNFNLAHEIGHYYYDCIELDSNIRDVERRADDFAGAFLLPSEGFIKDIIHDPLNINTYVDIKKKWHVSIASMMVRAYKLKVINNREYIQLQNIYNKNNWKELEPFDNELTRRAPSLLNSAVKKLLDEKFTIDEIMREFSQFGLPMYPGEIEYLLDLDYGTLTIDNIKLSICKEKTQDEH